MVLLYGDIFGIASHEQIKPLQERVIFFIQVCSAACWNSWMLGDNSEYGNLWYRWSKYSII